MKIDQILEGTFTLILAYLIIANAQNFSRVVASVASAYTRSVRVLQGR